MFSLKLVRKVVMIYKGKKKGFFYINCNLNLNVILLFYFFVKDYIYFYFCYEKYFGSIFYDFYSYLLSVMMRKYFSND